jgi:hypothetical protein
MALAFLHTYRYLLTGLLMTPLYRGRGEGAFCRQDDGDFGWNRGRKRLRSWEGVWGRETLRLGVGSML